jgi:outer membrane protein
MAGTALPVMLAGLLQLQDAVPAEAPAAVEDTAAMATADRDPTHADLMAAPSDPEPRAEGAPAVPAARARSQPESRWFVRAGVLDAAYNSHATIASNGAVIPGATAKVTDNVTVMFDVGYDITDNFAVMLMAGIPPKPSVIGKGSVSSFGTLGSVRYGPMFLTGVYRLPEWRGFRPYVGGGVVHAFIFKSFDGSVTQLKVNDNWGYALQAGVEYRLNRKWEAFVDYKRVWLDVKATGQLAGAPVRARVTLNPDVVSAGLKYHF